MWAQHKVTRLAHIREASISLTLDGKRLDRYEEALLYLLQHEEAGQGHRAVRASLHDTSATSHPVAKPGCSFSFSTSELAISDAPSPSPHFSSPLSSPDRVPLCRRRHRSSDPFTLFATPPPSFVPYLSSSPIESLRPPLCRRFHHYSSPPYLDLLQLLSEGLHLTGSDSLASACSISYHFITRKQP